MDENITDAVPAGVSEEMPADDAAETLMPEDSTEAPAVPQMSAAESENLALRQELSEASLREQDADMLADPDLGQAYRAVRESALSLVRGCRERGLVCVDVRAAFCSLLEENAGEIFRSVRESAYAEAVRHICDNRRATPGALSGGETDGGHNYAGMSPGDFERHVELAKAGMLRRY